MERKTFDWTEPSRFDSAVNSISNHWRGSMGWQGDVYSGDGYLCCSLFENGHYTPPARLPDVSDAVPESVPMAGDVGPFISPAGDHLFFSRFNPPPDFSTDMLISFRKSNGDWTQPLNLGEKLGGSEAARLSPDGK